MLEPEKKKTDKKHISISQIGTYTKCPKMWWYKYIAGYESKTAFTSQPLLMGKYWGMFIECSYTEWNEGNKSDRLEIEKEMADTWESISDQNKCKLNALMEAWDLKIKPLKMECEKKVLIPLNDEYDILGYMDRYKVMKSGEKVFVETKLTSVPDKYLALDIVETQLGVYFCSDEDIKRCKLEIIRTPQQRLKKDENYEDYTARILSEICQDVGKFFIGYNKKQRVCGKVVHKSEINIDRVKEDVYDVLNGLDKKIFFRNTDNCISNFGFCDYYTVCRQGVKLEEDLSLRKRNK